MVAPRKKVLVCGASGFIGRNVAEALARRGDLEVYGVHWSRPAPPAAEIIPVRADLTDAQQVNAAVRGMDVIVQAAATTSGAKDIVNRPYIHVTDNAVMNSLLLRAAYEHHVSRFLFFSCSVMYPTSDHPLKEDDFVPGAPMHPNYFGVGWTKVYIERMCEFYSRLGRTRHVAIRHSNIYGPHDKFDLVRSHVFGATVAKVMAPDARAVSVWGQGAEGRDLLYVDDLVEFVSRALDADIDAYELVNVGAGEAISVRSLVDRMIKASGRDLQVEYDPSKPSIPTSLCLNTARAYTRFGWRRQTSLEAGIDRTLAWYRNQYASP